jgi:1-acyl-sn-glycerol-3-phosphate acyltransferase
MYYKFMKIPLIRFLFRDGKVIPIAGKNEDPEILKNAMNEIESSLRAGDILCLFPEGGITKDGELDGFRPGIEKMLERVQVPVIPMTLNGLWGSFLSRKYGGRALSKPGLLLKPFLRKVDLDIYKAWDPNSVTAKKLEDFTRSKMTK